jgi:glycogen debranching enzyme
MSHRVQLRARSNQHFVYSGRSVLVTNLDGLVTGCGIEGFYAENTRVLNRFVLSAGGQALTAIAASPIGGSRLLGYYEARAGDGIPKEAIYLTLDWRIEEGLRLAIRVENYSIGEPGRFDLAIQLDGDFADADEAERGTREQQAEVERRWDETRRELWFRYRHPKLDRAARIQVSRAPGEARFLDGRLVFNLAIESRGSAELELQVQPFHDGWPGVPEQAPVAPIRERLRAEIPKLVTTNDHVARAWRTATEDLASMPLGHPAGPAAPMAGIPLYQQFFGRDTLTTAWQALPAMPSMMRDTLIANAALQGSKFDDWLDEEPGKLIHQATLGPLAALGITPYRRYYGDYATPPDFLIMLGQYLAWTGDLPTVRKLLPAARRVVDWIERYGDLDGDGLIEYLSRSPKGSKHQGWKDADDAIVDEKGAMIEPPIATCELQAYLYVGLQQAALAFFAAGDRAYSLELLAKARRLRRRVDEAFWMQDQDFYAMALGPDKRPVRSISSNPGHLLAAGIVPREKAAMVARRLLNPDMFSGWGIRTLSAAHPAYNPFSYHRGSVWPVENGTIALGFARYGLWDELHKLAEGIFALTALFQEGRLPESIAGLPCDEKHPHPGIYLRSCEPQSWSASMIVVLIQSLLGMWAVAPLRLLLVDPHLPDWLPDLRLEGIHVGEATVDLEAHRQLDGSTSFRAQTSGSLRVMRQPPPQAVSASLRGRAAAALRSLIS